MNPRNHLFALLLLLASGAAGAQPIEAEGVAAIDAGGIDKARQAALKDALRQAALSAGAMVQGSSTVTAHQGVRENLRVAPVGRVTRYTVEREWVAEGLLHVAIHAETEAAGSAESCGAGAAKYRKKIAATRFFTVNSLQVEDISDIWNGYPLELLRRFQSLQGLLPVGSRSSQLPGGTDPDPDSRANRDLVLRVAEQGASQFVISGVILDAGFGAETVRPYAGWQGTESGRRLELGLPWNSVVAGIRPQPRERRLEVEVFVHDGLTGALIARHRDSAVASGTVTVGRNIPFASAAFFSTGFGQAMEHLLDTQARAIGHDLACLPFTATIVRIDGRKAFLDAGATSSLAPGDKLTVYHRNPALAVSPLVSGAALGVPETPATTLTLSQVQPLFSVGELAGDPRGAGVQPGDVVRLEVQADGN